MRAIQLVRYNWPLYASAVLALIACLAVLTFSLSPVYRLGAVVIAAGTLWFSIASFVAFYWMFDRSIFTTWRWLLLEFDCPPARWVLMSAGLEETTGELQKVFPGTEGKIVEIFDAVSMDAPALNRARHRQPGRASSVVRPDALPVEDHWADAVIVALLAHEIRDRSLREKFFVEIKRIVSREGKIILVEHLRDLSAFLTFATGAFHFLPCGEWLRLASQTGLRVVRERSITPFIRVFVLSPQV